jgi:hypothetical protein
MTIAFTARIKEMNVKSFVSGERGLRLIIEKDNPDHSLIASIDELHSGTTEVAVAISELPQAASGAEKDVEDWLRISEPTREIQEANE